MLGQEKKWKWAEDESTSRAKKKKNKGRELIQGTQRERERERNKTRITNVGSHVKRKTWMCLLKKTRLSVADKRMVMSVNRQALCDGTCNLGLNTAADLDYRLGNRSCVY